MSRAETIDAALALAWHRQTAEASLDRWLQICSNENWGEIPEKIDSLITVFGASWYFTRFIFYRGKKSAALIDKPEPKDFDEATLSQFLSRCLQAEDTDNQFEWLRSLKNQAMLCLLLKHLDESIAASEIEEDLTRLAISTLAVAMKIAGIDLEDNKRQVTVMGMGRIAGYEMNFGSDLDLIFLYRDRGEDYRAGFSEKIRNLLRNMSLQTATGALYDIDMRLRPHGTSGALVTTAESFLDYHGEKREIWERQMMTRCLPIVDFHDLGGELMSAISGHIYAEDYDEALASEIASTRLRVEEELGTHKGKIDVKRGRGGIMDIDFLTHYYQLRYGSSCTELQVCSTRLALEVLGRNDFLDQDSVDALLSTYDHFKSIEACLRLFDLKSVNTFPSSLEDNGALVKAMGYRGKGAAGKFLDDYRGKCELVRTIYSANLA